jgi:hypothetical protein
MMRYFAGLVAVGTFCLSVAAPFAAAQAPPAQAQITGRVAMPNGNPLANATVRARNLIDGQISGTTSPGPAGQFTIGVNPGSYMLEVVDAGGQVIGTSPFIAATAGATIAGATITVSAGALGAVSTAAGLASIGTTVARSVTYAAAAAGVAGVVTPANVATASPSR